MPENICCSRTMVSMSAPPTDPACIFLLVLSLHDGVEITTGRDGGRDWKVDFFRYRRSVGPFSCTTSPVFHGGVFYCMGVSDGHLGVSWRTLGVYDPRRRTWTPHYLGIIEDRSDECILVESDGELLGVFGSRGAEHDAASVDPAVCRLNGSSMEWEVLTELRGRALFLDERSVIPAEAEVEGMKDRIFYSMSGDTTKKADGELRRSAGGCPGVGTPWLIPKNHVGSAKLAARSHHYSLDGASLAERSHRYALNGYNKLEGEEQEAEEQDEDEDEDEDDDENEDEEEDEEEDEDEDEDWMRLDVWVQPNWEQ